MPSNRKKRRITITDGPPPSPEAARPRGAERQAERDRTVRTRKSSSCKTREVPKRGPGHTAPSMPRPRPRGGAQLTRALIERPLVHDPNEPVVLPFSGGHHPVHGRSTVHVDPVDHPPVWLDARGHRRAPATMPGAGRGRTPKSKGQKYPRNPPTPGECVRLINGCPDNPAGHRMRAFIIIAWRTGLRISEILALVKEDLDEVQFAVVVRHGKGDKRRIIGMDAWGWQQLKPWLDERGLYPRGPIFCVLEGATAGRGWNDSQVRLELHRLAKTVGITKRIAPHQFRHAFAGERKREGADIFLLKSQLGHSKIDTTFRYIGDISPDEVLDAARVRATPTVLITDVLDTAMPALPDRGHPEQWARDEIAPRAPVTHAEESQ